MAGDNARITKQADRFFALVPGTVVTIAGRKFERCGTRLEYLCEPGPEGTRLGVDCIDLAAWAVADRMLMGSAKAKQGGLLERLAMAAAELGAGDNALGDVLAWRVAAIGGKMAKGREEFRAVLVAHTACTLGLAAYDAASDEDVAPFLGWTAAAQLVAITGPLRAYVGWAWAKGVLPMWSMRGANLRGANLRGADLRGADLVGANLRGADLSRANLVGANLARAILEGANFVGAILIRADLTGAYLSGADLAGANLRGAKLTGVKGNE